MPRTTRRRALYTLGTSLSVFAGCTQFESEPEEETGQSDGGASEPTATVTAAETDAATATDERATVSQTEAASETELDLREANVVGVELTDESGGDYRFDVTLYHDDDGEDGYANWCRSRRWLATDLAAGTSGTPTRRTRSPARRRSRFPTRWPASWSAATTRLTATAARR